MKKFSLVSLYGIKQSPKILTVFVVALLTFCAANIGFAKIIAVTPEAKNFKMGLLELSVLRDSGLVYSNYGKIFGLNADPTAANHLLEEAGVATNEIYFDVDELMVRLPGHIVLIDSGYGPANHGVILKSLALAGVSPADITDILISHSHLDHIGGLIDAEGHSIFPKAVIRMSSNEWAFMRTTTNAAVAVIKLQVTPFEPGHEILPGITAVPLFGHTPGHTGYEIVSGSDRLMVTGDLAHSSILSLKKPEWTLAWDADRKKGAAMRRRELQQLVDHHEWVFAPHFPFPGIGRIETSDGGFKFVPALPEK